MAERKEEKLEGALLKVALGYQIAEITEEYAEVDGQLKLTKRKKTKRDIPPDLKAVQMLLLGEGNGEYATLSDEQLEEERKRLLNSLQLAEAKQNGEGKVAAKAKKTKKKTGK